MAQQLLTLAILSLLTMTPQLVGDQPAAARKSQPWCGLHVIVFKNDKDLEILGRQIPKLGALGGVRRGMPYNRLKSKCNCSASAATFCME
jgi:hypothetical protein